jgi:hypothetical protein
MRAAVHKPTRHARTRASTQERVHTTHTRATPAGALETLDDTLAGTGAETGGGGGASWAAGSGAAAQSPLVSVAANELLPPDPAAGCVCTCICHADAHVRLVMPGHMRVRISGYLFL